MSKDQPSSKRKPKFTIEPLQITKNDRDSVRRVMSRMFDHGEQAAPPQQSETLPSTPPRRGASTSASVRPRRDVSPQRDFQKVANSITREAVPAGTFNGKAKQLYDCLYSLTRGAIVPSMTVRISRAELMKKSGIGAKVTLEQNLRRLIAAGLVRMKTIGGIQGGNEYRVHLPEESTMPSTPPSTGTSPPSPPSGGQKLGVLAPLETRDPRYGLNVDAAIPSGEPNTSFKTSTNTDDEAAALSDLVSICIEAARKLTGRAPRASEREQWAELGRVLVEELNDAASRAESVSSVPAFLTAHLRRKLAPKPVARKREGNQKPDVGVPSTPSPDPNRRLTAKEIEEQARVIAEVIEGGYTMEQAEAQFSGSFHGEDWTAIRSVALAQVATKEGK